LSHDLDELAERGIFDILRAIPYVVEVMQLSRATIYIRLATIRKHAVASPPKRTRK
jgi:predicted transcriptional regulator YheO